MDTPSTPTSSFRHLISTDLNSPRLHLSSSSSSSSSLAIHIPDQPCYIQDVPPPIRSMMLDYMDDTTAIHFLTTTRHYYTTTYHTYPLKRALSVKTLLAATDWGVHNRRSRRADWLRVAGQVFLAVISNSLAYIQPQSLAIVLQALSWSLFALSILYFTGHWLLARRTNCCAGERRLRPWRRRWVPRVTRLSEELYDVRLLRYLQHITELTITSTKLHPIGKKCNQLPHSLRTLTIHSSPLLKLTPTTLPPHLTTLSLSTLHTAPLTPNLLPPTLTTLRLTSGFDTRWPIPADVLPASLRRLQIDGWQLPLSDIVLPAGLIELDVGWLGNNGSGLGVLPEGLEMVRVGGAFNQSLMGCLPVSLRVLQLCGHFNQPLTAELFAGLPQLEELYLSDHLTTQEVAANELPRTLHVLRLGKRYATSSYLSTDPPPQLRRLILPKHLPAARLREMQQFGQLRGFAVDQE